MVSPTAASSPVMAPETVACVHCGSALGKFWRPEDGPFCCRGCRTVHELISAGGLDRYYDLRQGTQPPASLPRADGMAWFDGLVADLPADAPWRLSLDIQGVHCAACVWLLEELFRREPGGVSLRINPTLGAVDLIWDPTRGDLRAHLAAVESFGYKLGPARKERRQASRGLLIRMAICIAVAMNVMMFSLSFYFGLAPRDGAIYGFFGWLSCGLSTLAAVVGGQVFFRAAFAGLRRRIVHLDLPISLGILLAWGGSVVAFVQHGPEHAYFDTLTTFIALMLVGRWAREHVLERNRNTLLADAGAEQLSVKRRAPDGLTTVAAPAVARGDELWIAPGDVVPVEGMLLRTTAEVTLDWITGESQQVALAPGETVPAGAFNVSERGFAVTAMESFATSRLQGLLRTPAATPVDERRGWWHRVSSVYVGAVLTAAAVGLAIWLPRDPQQALQVTIAILVVTCPCALGLATPLAEELVHHALRRRGVLLRKADFLEKSLRVRKILLDKTGTLTLGELVLEPASAAALASVPAHERAVLAEMTARSNHPVSRAMAAALRRLGPAPTGTIPVDELREMRGVGLALTCDGREYTLSRGDGADGETVFAVDGRPAARLRLREHLKADAAAEIADLARRGYEIHLLSGDAPAKVQAAAAALGIDPARAEGGLSPEAKADRVRALDRDDTLMVGDGLNDAPSFAAAWCAATPAVDRPVLPGKADFYFLGDGVAALRRALLAGQHLRRVFRANLVFAVTYNLAAIAFCLAGRVNPVVAAIIMPATSILVVSWTTYRLTGRRLAWMS